MRAYIYSMKKQAKYGVWELKQLILFIRKQSNQPIKVYIQERAHDLGISNKQSFQELMDSAIDWYIDKQVDPCDLYPGNMGEEGSAPC